MVSFEDFLKRWLNRRFRHKKNDLEKEPKKEIDFKKLHEMLVAEKENFQFKSYKYTPPTDEGKFANNYDILPLNILYGFIEINIDEDVLLVITKGADKKSVNVDVYILFNDNYFRKINNFETFNGYDFVKLFCVELKNAKAKYNEIDMTAKSIKAVLEAELKDFRYQWTLTDNYASTLLEIRIKRIIKIRISYKDFSEQNPPFVEKVRSIKKIATSLEELEKVNNFEIMIQRYG